MGMLSEQLVLRILILAVESDDMDATSAPTGWRRRVEISSVCKTWRRVTLECPAFWAGFTLHPGLQGLLEMLPRWQDSPRSVYIDLKDGYEPWTRIREQHEELLAASYVGRLTVMTGADSTRLEELMALLSPGPCELVVCCAARSTTITGLFFAAIPPGALQILSLENCSVEWSVLRSLGTSSSGRAFLDGLHSVHLARLWPPLPNDILDLFLSTAPHLESLQLIDALPDDLSLPSRCRWHTSSLRSCHLEGPLDLVSKMFLQIMSMPVRADLRIAFRSSYSGPHLSFPPDPATWLFYEEVFQAFFRFIDESGFLDGRTVEIYEQEAERFLLKVRTQEAFSEGRTEHSVLEMELPPSFSHPPPATSRRSTFLENIRLPSARHLVLHSTSTIHLSERTWCRFFELHPNIETLELKAQYMLDPIITIVRLLTSSSGGSGCSPSSSSRGREWRCLGWGAKEHMGKERQSTEEDFTSPVLPNLRKLVLQGLRSQRHEVKLILAELKTLLHSRSSSVSSRLDWEKALEDGSKSGFLVELGRGEVSNSDLYELRKDVPGDVIVVGRATGEEVGFETGG